MIWTLERKIAAGFGFGLAILVLVGGVQHWTIQTLVETDRLVAYTNAVLTELAGAFSAVQDVESLGHSYVGMGQQRFIGQIQESIADARGHFQRLRKLTADNPRQQRNLNRLEPVVEKKIAFMLRLIELRRTEGEEAATGLLDQGEGLRLMDEVRRTVDSMTSEETGLLAARRAASATAARDAELVSLFGTAIALSLILAAAWIVRRDLRRRKQAETALHRSEERYRGLVVATSQIVWTTNAQGDVVGDLPSWRTFTGQSRQEIQGAGWAQALHPEDRDETLEIWSKAVATRSPYDTEYRIRRHDGRSATSPCVACPCWSPMVASGSGLARARTSPSAALPPRRSGR
jgi:PAS domain S-box-containing protein